MRHKIGLSLADVLRNIPESSELSCIVGNLPTRGGRTRESVSADDGTKLFLRADENQRR